MSQQLVSFYFINQVTYNMLLIFIILTYFFLIKNYCFFPSLILAGKSTALLEEIEAKEKELIKQRTELQENIEEREKVNQQNSEDGDNDSPYEQDSADELVAWDELIEHSKQTIEALMTWFSN